MEGARHWWWQRPFVYIGRMAEDKGVTSLVRAWTALKSWRPHQCPPLWLAGGSPQEVEHVRAVSGLSEGIAPHEREGVLHWWGYLDPPGLSALLTRACVLLTHSRYEPGGRVVIEAMAQGVPVIATPNGFAQDLIRDWRNGFLVEFGDTDLLTRRMAHFVLQPLLRNVLGANARETVRNALEEWSFLDAHIQVYDQATGAQPVERTNRTPAPAAPRNYFGSRRVIPTHPNVDDEPDTHTVRAFAERHLDRRVIKTRRIEHGPGSSTRWRLTAETGDWIVKWPYPRLVTRVLWDPFHGDSLLSATRTRFERELFSGALPCFSPWTASDPASGLLLRPALQPLPATCEPALFIELAARYRELQRHPLPRFSWETALARDWDATNVETMETLRRTIREELATTPWAPARHVSVRMAWRMMALDMARLDGPFAGAMDFVRPRDIEAFRALAEAEAGSPLVVSHGSGDLAHCLRDRDGQLIFIDGEHVHPAQAGEDMAVTIYFAIEDAGETAREGEVWRELLPAVAADAAEADVLLAWAGLTALEIARKHAAMSSSARADSQTRWETLARLAREGLSR